jgi:hypothetical protein
MRLKSGDVNFEMSNASKCLDFFSELIHEIGYADFEKFDSEPCKILEWRGLTGSAAGGEASSDTASTFVSSGVGSLSTGAAGS